MSVILDLTAQTLPQLAALVPMQVDIDPNSDGLLTCPGFSGLFLCVDHAAAAAVV